MGCLWRCRYNISTGGPAPSSLTNAMFEITKSIASYPSCDNLPDVDLHTIGRTVFRSPSRTFEVEVIDSCEDLLAQYKRVFDFDTIRAYLQRSNMSFTFDGLSGGVLLCCCVAVLLCGQIVVLLCGPVVICLQASLIASMSQCPMVSHRCFGCGAFARDSWCWQSLACMRSACL